MYEPPDSLLAIQAFAAASALDDVEVDVELVLDELVVEAVEAELVDDDVALVE